MGNKGIVVDHKETDARYAISERNFNDRIHTFVRDLKPGETVRGFNPKPRLQHEQDEAAAEAERMVWREELAEAQNADQLDFTQLEDEPSEAVQALLDLHSLDELKDLAREAELPVSGTKRELAESLIQHTSEGSSTPE